MSKLGIFSKLFIIIATVGISCFLTGAIIHEDYPDFANVLGKISGLLLLPWLMCGIAMAFEGYDEEP